MARVSVTLPAGISLQRPQALIEVGAVMVRDALEQTIATDPRLEGRVFGSGGRPVMAVFLNGRSVKRLEGMETHLRDGDALLLAAPIAGG